MWEFYFSVGEGEEKVGSGGIISPTLCNCVLDGMKETIRQAEGIYAPEVA